MWDISALLLAVVALGLARAGKLRGLLYLLNGTDLCGASAEGAHDDRDMAVALVATLSLGVKTLQRSEGLVLDDYGTATLGKSGCTSVSTRVAGSCASSWARNCRA